MQNQFQITALDETGSVVIEERTFESWSISEVQIYLDKAKMDLYTGKIRQLIIERI